MAHRATANMEELEDNKQLDWVEYTAKFVVLLHSNSTQVAAEHESLVASVDIVMFGTPPSVT